ncbi:integrase core domain-containing protein [Streptomyces sp. NPDC056479]|uniref:integrase core domain-containing protein n=1 Tax=Streptomyces sp. NPDC056479 TaxID=3345832 RepID=UPI00369E35ED
MKTAKTSQTDVRVITTADRRRGVVAWLLLAAPDKNRAHAEWEKDGAAVLQCGLLFTAVRIPGTIVRAAAGTAHTYIKPRTPRLNGKVERSHRIDAEEFYRLLDGVIIDDAEVFNDKLREWEDYYNYHRPHGGLGGQTPDERLKQKTTAQAQSKIVSCTRASGLCLVSNDAVTGRAQECRRILLHGRRSRRRTRSSPAPRSRRQMPA